MIALALLGCTFQPGQGFSSVDDAWFEVRYEPGAARDLGGATLTDQAYEISFEALSMEVTEISLDTLEGGEDVAFDPAAPPDGYSNCHGGHCHAADGSLVDYSEIVADLAGDDAAFVPQIIWSIGADADLLAGEGWALTEPSPSAALDLVTIDRASIGLGGVSVQATAAGGALPEGESIALSVALPLEATTVDLGVIIDREQAPSLVFEGALEIDGTLFDGLDLGALAEDGALAIDADHGAAAAVLENLYLNPVEASLTGL